MKKVDDYIRQGYRVYRLSDVLPDGDTIKEYREHLRTHLKKHSFVDLDNNLIFIF